MLGNIHPRYRSSLKSIQLLAICKNKHIKTYGLDTVIQHFVNDIKKFEEVHVCVCVCVSVIDLRLYTNEILVGYCDGNM